MKNLFIIFFSFILGATLFAQNDQNERIISAMHSISSHDLLDYVKIQCEDRFEGRLTGTDEYMECARWLASFFQDCGLEPAGDNNSWFQYFNIPYTVIHPDCGISLELPAGESGSVQKHYKYITEYMPGSTSGNGTVNAEVVYAGYGITAPELDYDDYKGIDVKGKIILIEREAPVSPAEGPEKFNPWREYSFHQYKLHNAVKHGAAGMIYNYGPIANPNNAYDENFIYVHVGDSVVRDIFSGTGKSHLETVGFIKKNLEPASFETGKKASIKMSTTHFPDGKGANIIGIKKGTDAGVSNETIIIGAHLDHLGKCYEIIPGANDNASAVAVLMAVAKALNDYNIELKRTVLFMAFGAEEQALVGARTYVENPLRPLEKTVLLNMDGVGVGDKINITAGKDFPLLCTPFEEVNNKYIHRTVRSNSFSNLGRPRLDAAIFLSAGVPSLSFSTFGARSYYHIPWDNIDIITPEIMEDMAQLMLLSVIELANSDENIM
ncbi:MAG: M28 family peptidase [Bacteroidales bacterium]|nr:M28 family peptidase [Bacteroidales bacterium]